MTIKPVSLKQFVDDARSSNELEINIDYYDAVCAVYRERNDAYAVISQINQLIKSVQKHRGYTMGLLSGDQSYQERFRNLQEALQRRLKMLEIYSSKSDELLSEREKSNLYFCWHTISNNWQGDNATESLELHSHFVEELLTLLGNVSANLSAPLLDDMTLSDDEMAHLEKMESFPYALAKLEVLAFVSKTLPEGIENVGKLRALSTHVAVEEEINDSDFRKLRFLVDTVRGQANVLRSVVVRLNDVCRTEFDALKIILEMEIKLELILSQIENSILVGRPMGEEAARQLFVRTTLVIDSYWFVGNKGFDLMRQWHDQEFDFWLAANSI